MRVEREKSAQKEAEIMERMNKAVEEAEKYKSPSKGLFAVIGGVVTTVAGVVTLNPALAAAGVAMAAGGGGRAIYKATR